MIKNISITEAALGSKIEIPLLDGGFERLKIPEGTQNNDIFKISNKGMPNLHGRGYGDLFVEVNVKTHRYF